MEMFTKELKKEVENKLDSNYLVQINKVNKNNNIVLDAISIRENGNTTSPNIYLSQFYEAYKNNVSLDSIAEKIIEVYEEHKNTQLEANWVMDWEKVKDKIFYVLVNKETNSMLKETCITSDYLDMMLVYKIAFQQNDSDIMTITIKKDMLNTWHVSKKDIISAAAKNTAKILPMKIESLTQITKNSILNSSIPENEKEFMLAAIEMQETPMLYVLSNYHYINGASVILYKDELKNIAKKLNTNILYIIPSSIHEVIVYDAKMETDLEDTKEMINFINGNKIEPEEYLSGNLYKYSIETDSIEIVE